MKKEKETKKVGFPSREIKRGEIYSVDLPLEDNGCVQKGKRPCLIIQNDTGNKYSPNVLIVPITSKQKTSLPTHIYLNNILIKDSTILCEQIMTISKWRIREKMGELDCDTMKLVNKALICELGL